MSFNTSSYNKKLIHVGLVKNHPSKLQRVSTVLQLFTAFNTESSARMK